MSDVKPIPDGYPRITPYLCCDGCADAIGFYKSVFGATERMRMDAPGGRLGHAELELGDSILMLSDPYEEMGVRDPKAIGGTPVTISVYVEDADAVVARAVEAGATETSPVEEQFYGDRRGQFTDPWGHRWSIATHVEDVPPEEMEKRAAEAASSS